MLRRGFRDISIRDEDEDEDILSNFVMTPRTISSLDLPDPLFSIHGPSPKLLPSSDSIQQVDGANPSKVHNHKPTQHGSDIPGPESEGSCSHQKDLDPLSRIPKTDSIKMLQSYPNSGSHEIRRPPRRPSKNSHKRCSRSLLNGNLKRMNISVGKVGADNPVLSPKQSPYITSTSHLKGQHEQYRDGSLDVGEVLRIIGHRPLSNKSFEYLILWKQHNSGILSEVWVKATDLLEGIRKVILEEYHLRQDLGLVRWPRDPRRQWRSSTSFGVQEIRSALDERKKTLLDRGVSELEATQEMNEERWKMRDGWQRAGRGWGSALMITKYRKQAWSVADSNTAESQLASTNFEDITSPEESLEVSSSDHIAMMQAAGMLDLNTDQCTLKQEPSPNRLGPGLLASPPNNRFKTGSSKYPEKEDEAPNNQFAVTSDDEREWREHFMPEPIGSRVGVLPFFCRRTTIRVMEGVLIQGQKLSNIKPQRSGLSRVRSTLHSLPNGLKLELVRAATLPELPEKITNFRSLPKVRLREPIQSSGSKSTKSIDSTVSEAQSYLEAQRKNLLSRMLSRGPFKEFHKKPKPDSRPVERSQSNLLFLETATEPFRRTESQLPGKQSGRPAATQRSSSYISFDGANSAVKKCERESWAKKIWNKFSHLFTLSSRTSLGDRKRCRTKSQTPTYTGGEMQVPSILASDKIQTIKKRNPEAITVTSKVSEVGNIEASKNVMPDNPQQNQTKTQQAQPHTDVVCPADPPKLKPAMVETSAGRTALWAANLPPMLYKSRSEEPQRMELVPPSEDETGTICDMVFASSQINAETVKTTNLSLIPLRNSSEAGALSDQAHHIGKSLRQDRGKGKANPTLDTPIPTQSEPLTRTNSQQQYLVDRETERQARRDRNVLRTKIKVKKMKEKADLKAERLKRLNRLHSMKACPFGKWSKKDQVELELLRMKLGLRGAKNSWKRGDLRKLNAADLQELKESLLPTAKAASRQPKGQSPV